MSEPHTFRTKSGRALTAADIEALADEAERGYDIRHLLAKRAMGLRKFGPKLATVVDERECPACHRPFKAGDFTALVPLGPGADPEEQEKAREHRAYNAVAVEVHWACATGETEWTGETERALWKTRRRRR